MIMLNSRSPSEIPLLTSPVVRHCNMIFFIFYFLASSNGHISGYV